MRPTPTVEFPKSRFWYSHAVDALLPAQFTSDVEAVRGRMLAALLLIFSSAWMGSLLVLLAAGSPRDTILTAVCAGLGYPAFMLLLRRGRVTQASWAFCLWATAALSVAAWRHDGVWMLALPWTSCLPLLATYLAGWRMGGAVAAVLSAQTALYLISSRVDAPPTSLTVGASTFVVLIIVAVVAGSYEQHQQDARARLLRALDDKARSDAARTISEENVLQIIENAPDLINIHRDGVLLYVNRRMAAALGYAAAAELVGRRLEQLTHPDEHVRLRERIARYSEGSSVPAAEYKLLRRDGTVLHAEFKAFVGNYDGAQAIIGIGRDLSERKQLDARLAIADRMASVGTLAAGVAHELNNPLTFVTANLAFVRTELEAEGAPDAAQRADWTQAIAEAEDGARRMKLIIQDLKTYSRADDSDVRIVDVAKAIRTSLRLAENEVRHRARLVLELSPDAFIRANEARLGQVVINLVVNAAQAIRVGDADQHTISVRSTVEGGLVRICVSDTGCGIARENLPRVFEPFYTTKAVGEGTGLGLFICHNLIKAMGGELSVQSTLGVGTTVTATVAAQSIAPAAQTSGARFVGSSKPRVLVVDDDALVGRSVKRTLKAYDVTVTDSGHEALSRLREGEVFDVILCDLMMPDMDGPQLYAALGDGFAHLQAKVLFLTGGAFTPHAQAFLDSGKAWIAKPYDNEVLVRAIESVAQGTRIAAA